MKLELTDDQRMIRDAAAQFLAKASGAPAVRAALESEAGFDERAWRSAAEMGWCGTAVAEDCGGLGLGPTELVLILEQMGRHLFCGPFFSSVALTANLLSEAGGKAARAKYLPGLADGSMRGAAAFEAAGVKARKGKGGWLLTGRIAGVSDAASADVLLVATGAGIYAVGAKAFAARPLTTWDGTRRLADVELKNAPAERVDDAGRQAGLARAKSLAQLYLAAEQLGGAQQCLDITVRYTSERRQFGRPIASFQAVKHRCAQMMVKVEGLRSLVYGAAASRDALDCAGAKALASETYFHCAAEAIQLHGGVGFTWEFEPQLHFKRAQAGSHALGTADALRERIAQELL